MPDVTQKALAQVTSRLAFDKDAFYGKACGLSLGVGLIYQDVTFPAFSDESGFYDTLSGLAYILTHECDVDESNNRHFNSEVLVIPIILFEEFTELYIEEYSEGALFAFLNNLSANEVSRVLYIPPIPQHLNKDILSYGGLLYLNNICSSPITCFAESGAKPICATSINGLRVIDYKLQNHLLRPKAQPLPRLR
jgi:hypothetical protein